MTTSTAFRNLHLKNSAFVLINVWDSASAAIVQKSGSSALATSSASLAWANGYAEGGALPRDILLSSISKILRVCEVPLTVDIEDGYSDSPSEVAELVADLTSLGISGINIEDGVALPETLSEKISAIRRLVDRGSLFINARTDVYLRELVDQKQLLSESIARLERYIAAGADGIFIPGLSTTSDISSVSSVIQAPLNIMIGSDSVNIEELFDAGAIRLSLGPNSFLDAYSTLPIIVRKLLTGTVEDSITYDSLNALF